MAKRHAAIIGDTLLNLDHKSLSVLKREFDKKTRENARADRVRKGSKDKNVSGLTCAEFVSIILQQTFAKKYKKERIVAALMFFFKQVDIDSDGFMTWAEFVNNCIESSNASTMDEKRQTSNSFKYTETQIKYTKDKLILRDSMYKTSQAKWVDAVQRVFVLEVGSNTVAVLHKDLTIDYIIEVLHPDAYTEKDARERHDRALRNESQEAGQPPRQILAFEVLQIHDQGSRPNLSFITAGTHPKAATTYIALATQTGTIAFFDITRASKSMGQNRVDPVYAKELELSFVAVSLAFVKISSALIAVPQSIDSMHTPHGIFVHLKQKALIFGRKFKMKGHKGKVTTLFHHGGQFPVVTTSMDGKIYFWYSNEPKKVSFYRKCHKRGILTATPCNNSTFATAGFEGVIQIWNYLATSKTPLFVLQGGHQKHLICKLCSPSNNNLLSVDDGGTFVRWNLSEKLVVSPIMQTFRSTAKIREQVEAIAPLALDQSAFGAEGQHPNLEEGLALPFMVVTDRRLRVFNPAPSWKRDICRPTAIVYNPSFSEFVMAADFGLLVVCAETGKLNRDFNYKTIKKPICNLSFDSAFHRLVIADQSGTITIVNYLNGVVQRTNAKRHRQNNISALKYVNEDKLIITSSWDRSICIWEDGKSSAQTIGLVRKLENTDKNDITCLSFSYHLSILACGTAGGDIIVLDYQTLTKKTVFDFSLQSDTEKCEITSVGILAPYPIVVSTDSVGNVNIWNMESRRSNSKEALVTSFPHTPIAGVQASVISSTILHIPATTDSRNKMLLFAGDEFGCTSCWDLKPVLEYDGVAPVRESPSMLENFNPRRRLFQGGAKKKRKARKGKDDIKKNVHLFNGKTSKGNERRIRRTNSMPVKLPGAKSSSRRRLTTLISEKRNNYHNRPRRPITWTGHRTPVVLLEPVYEPNSPYPFAVVSAALDGSHRLWSHAGKAIGSLPFTNRDMSENTATWGYPIDRKKQYEEEMKDAAGVIELIEERENLAAEGKGAKEAMVEAGSSGLRLTTERPPQLRSPGPAEKGALQLTFLTNDRGRILRQMGGEVTWKLSPAEKARKALRERDQIDEGQKPRSDSLVAAGGGEEYDGSADDELGALGLLVLETSPSPTSKDRRKRNLEPLQRETERGFQKFFPNFYTEKNKHRTRRNKLTDMKLKRAKESVFKGEEEYKARKRAERDKKRAVKERQKQLKRLEEEKKAGEEEHRMLLNLLYDQSKSLDPNSKETLSGYLSRNQKKNTDDLLAMKAENELRHDMLTDMFNMVKILMPNSTEKVGEFFHRYHKKNTTDLMAEKDSLVSVLEEATGTATD